MTIRKTQQNDGSGARLVETSLPDEAKISEKENNSNGKIVLRAGKASI
jgi:hypothetical protein